MSKAKTILVIGTYDTKSDELSYLTACIEKQGGATLTMDVSVLGNPPSPTNFSKHDVAAAVGSSKRPLILAMKMWPCRLWPKGPRP
jgi:uncharacterized protein (UPF0261 family)